MTYFIKSVNVCLIMNSIRSLPNVFGASLGGQVWEAISVLAFAKESFMQLIILDP